MNRDDLTARIKGAIVDALCLEPHDVTDASLFTDLTDDFGRLEIIMAAEDIADVEISDAEAEELKTVGALVAFVAERLGLAEAVDA